MHESYRYILAKAFGTCKHKKDSILHSTDSAKPDGVFVCVCVDVCELFWFHSSCMFKSPLTTALVGPEMIYLTLCYLSILVTSHVC